MNDAQRIRYRTGIPERLRSRAVALYDEAFGSKLALAVSDPTQRRQLLMQGFVLEYAIAAISAQGLLGIAGLQTANGSLTGGIQYRDLLQQLGFLRGNLAATVFGLYERQAQPGQLLMDGIVVDRHARGLGIGGRLLDEVCRYARRNDYRSIRLDVIDTNPRAKQLYERVGFKTVKVERFPLLQRLLGFGGTTTMVRDV